MLVVAIASGGKLEEPEAVRQQREEMRQAIAAAEGEERKALEEEFAKDPIAADPSGSLWTSRVSFGPFLCLGMLEYMLLAREWAGNLFRGALLD
jgi:leader peptidase (prepilin peptidase)/N-methyltransferase